MWGDSDDVCLLPGGAWIGEEAVACALWCVLRAGGDFRETVLRGANSSGDSDSIACIAGSMAGAFGGLAAIPVEWSEQVEQIMDEAVTHIVRTDDSESPDKEAGVRVITEEELLSLIDRGQRSLF